MAKETPEVVETPEDTSIRGDILAAVETTTKPEGVQPDQTIPAAKETKPAKEEKAAKEPKEVAVDTKPEPAGTPEPVAVVEPGADPVEGAKPEGDTLAAPSNWSTADKERFAELPKPAQELILGRHKAMEADYTRKTMEIADLKKEYSVVDEMFAPYKLQLRQRGQTPASVIQGWAAAEQALMNPATREQAILGIAKGYGVDLAKLAGTQAQALTQQPIDPANMTEQQQLEQLLNPFVQQALTPYQKEIEALKAQIAQAQQFQTGSLQAQQQQVVQSTVQEVQNFASAKDPQGNLLHPYFSDVENDMATIMAGYQARQLAVPSLDEVYQLAVRANPSTYERLTAQQMRAADKKREDEARAKSAQASRAGSSVRGGPVSGQPFTHAQGNGQDLSVRDSIMAAMEASQGRA